MTALVQAENLTKQFTGRGVFGFGAKPVRALSNVSLSVARGEAVGVVGESGSGKSTIGRILLGLTPASSGSVRFDGVEVSGVTGRAARALRRRMQLVFQDPYASLDPRRRVSAQIADGLLAHGLATRSELPKRVAALLDQVGLPPSHADRFPHEFSGGQRQRIGIARALAVGPEFLVADEPVSALDVSIQAQVLALLADLRVRLGLAMLFISHDLSVVRSLCDRVVVLYLGRIMEEGPVAEVLGHPRHPYTAALLSAAPSIDPIRRRQRILLSGDPPSPANPPSGCVFRTRCPWALPACADAVPPLQDIGSGHRVACIRSHERDFAPNAGVRAGSQNHRNQGA
jgi:oligopeptide/dipeptide ABC transporter ATP-binding protein